MEQWSGFGSGHDDLLDAVEKAYESVILGGEAVLNYNGLNIEDMGDDIDNNEESYNDFSDEDTFNVLRINF
jgi:hypothetical protein